MVGTFWPKKVRHLRFMKTQCYIPLGFFLIGKGKSNLAPDLPKKLHFELLLLF